MKLTKESLEKLYSSMSIDEMAAHLDMAKSTLYYHMRKLGVTRRSKSDAQRQHLKNAPHQRSGKSHSTDAKARIADGTRRFWESPEGREQKKQLGTLRRNEWKKRSARQRSAAIRRLQSAARPGPGELSRFGTKLAAFLEEREEVKTGIKLTASHISDIILVDRKVVIELLLPISVYGERQEQKTEARYDKLTLELVSAGYRVVVIEDRSNSLSRARCERVYDELLKFFDDTSVQRLTVVS
jgi:AcrR family transcriptional regulator